MFLSKQQLSQNFGIDPEIAAFFVDRPVPQNNMYWKDKLLYMRHKPGYLFIPLFTDLLLRLGIPKENLLGNTFVQGFEKILDGAAREEFGMLEEAAHVRGSYQVLRSEPGADAQWLDLMERHFILRTERLPSQPSADALCRADSFLLALALLPLDGIDREQVFRLWYSLVGFFLLLDDIEDFEKDTEAGDENALIQWGSGEKAAVEAEKHIDESIANLETISPKMARYCTSLINKFEIRQRLKTLAAV